MNEIWKDLAEFNDRYSISNLGRIYSNLSKKMLKQTRNKGYLMIKIFNEDGTIKRCSVHRLVASAFIENPFDYPEINHIDENKENNCVNNLEWCTSKYNANYGKRNAKISVAMQKRYQHKAKKESTQRLCSCKSTHKKKDKKIKTTAIKDVRSTKKIVALDVANLMTVRIFESQKEALKTLGKPPKASGISFCLTGRSKSSYGYVWKYLD